MGKDLSVARVDQSPTYARDYLRQATPTCARVLACVEEGVPTKTASDTKWKSLTYARDCLRQAASDHCQRTC